MEKKRHAKAQNRHAEPAVHSERQPKKNEVLVQTFIEGDFRVSVFLVDGTGHTVYLDDSKGRPSLKLHGRELVVLQRILATAADIVGQHRYKMAIHGIWTLPDVVKDDPQVTAWKERFSK